MLRIRSVGHFMIISVRVQTFKIFPKIIVSLGLPSVKVAGPSDFVQHGPLLVSIPGYVFATSCRSIKCFSFVLLA